MGMVSPTSSRQTQTQCSRHFGGPSTTVSRPRAPPSQQAMSRVPSFVSSLSVLRTRSSSFPLSRGTKCSATSGTPTTEQNVGIATALFRKRGGAGPIEVLLVKRGKQPNVGLWALPGGRVEDGESLFAGAMRELEEETAITEAVILPDPVDTKVISIEGRPDWKLHVFAGYQEEMEEPTALTDAAEVTFLSTDQLEHLPTVDGLERTVIQAMRVIAETVDL